jgi:hypothetical protein
MEHNEETQLRGEMPGWSVHTEMKEAQDSQLVQQFAAASSELYCIED